MSRRRGAALAVPGLIEPIFVSAYGGGPFEYMDILEEWRDKKFAKELDLVPMDTE